MVKVQKALDESTSFEIKLPEQRELLYFPRKVLDMENLLGIGRNNGFEAYVIANRTNVRSTKLNYPTHLTLTGLTSGLRSAIVLDKDGKYLRLKGVARRVILANNKYANGWGACFHEGYFEVANALSLLLSEPRRDLIAISPKYLFEVFLDNTLRGIKVNSLVNKRVKLYLKDKTRNLVINDQQTIPVYEIYGDTRVDEALYELTKKDLSGKKAKERDELVREISFNAGRILGLFNLSGKAYYSLGDGAPTDNHLGNFVLSSKNSDVCVQLTDIQAIGNIESKVAHVPLTDVFRELLSFEQDFQAEYTTSMPTCLPYRHFPNYLRSECFQEFLMGYSSANVPGVNIKSSKIKRNPRKISEKEFRERIAYVVD